MLHDSVWSLSLDVRRSRFVLTLTLTLVTFTLCFRIRLVLALTLTLVAFTLYFRAPYETITVRVNPVALAHIPTCTRLTSGRPATAPGETPAVAVALKEIMNSRPPEEGRPRLVVPVLSGILESFL